LEQKQSEDALLQMMQYIVVAEYKEAFAEWYLSLWDGILSDGRKICMSAKALNRLKSLMLVSDFEQGRENNGFGGEDPSAAERRAEVATLYLRIRT
jgi:hypothetical protein